MTLLKIILSISLASMTAFQPDTHCINHTLKGIVVNKATGKPIPSIYVYTIKGEEEAVTDSAGVFQLVTWQKLPVTLYIQYEDKENLRVVVSNPNQSITIKL